LADETTTLAPSSPAPVAPPPGVPPVLDEAQIGDIQGALGTIRMHETAPRRGWRARLLALLAIMGPGIIVMVGDNDAGGVSTYAQAGQNYGTSLLWTLLLLIPVLIVNQEMVVRLGAVTGVGLAKLVYERFGRFWGWYSVTSLFLLNFCIIVTEFIGVRLALGYFGVSEYVAVPAAAICLVLITASGSFRSWERFMYLFVVANFLVIPLVVMAHPDLGTVTRDSFVPRVQGGVNSTSVLLIIAIVGTTVAPWQLFFQQSNLIDKRITPRWINYERADTIIGAFVVVLGAGALITATAFAFRGTPAYGQFTDAGATAHGLAHYLGSTAGAFFAVILLNASLIGAAAVTLSTSYAFGDIFGSRQSLNRGFREAKGFYASFTGLIAVAAIIVLIPGAPLGVITTAVQALAGILLPGAIVFLLMLCNDRDILGPWVNRPWLNALAGVIIGVLIVLSIILMLTTVFTSIDVTRLTVYLSGALLLTLLGAGIQARLRRPRLEAVLPLENRESWTMPPLALLDRPKMSAGRRLAMSMLSTYVVVAIVLLVVKAVQLGGG
jgi:NRAMP (natural resistance-associated macrophage protein)-like metal ion transporter